MTLIIEHKKVSGNIGVTVFELLQDDVLVTKGKVAGTTKMQVDSFNWGSLKTGESCFEGYAIDLKEETLLQNIKQGFNKSIKDGRVPFFPK